MKSTGLLLGLLISLSSMSTMAEPQWVRWTASEDSNADLQHILLRLKSQTGIEIAIDALMPIENRRLATSHFTMLNQVQAGLPVRHRHLRLWTSLKDGRLIQFEALVEKMVLPPHLSPIPPFFDSQKISHLAISIVKKHVDDPHVRGLEWKDYWENGERVRIVTIKGKRGKHAISISMENGRVVESNYDEFPQGEFGLPVQVYPIYEEVETTNEILTRIPSELRYLNQEIPRTSGDPYAPLKSVRYDYELYDPLLGLTAAGRKNGYWSMGYVKSQAAELIAALPFSQNSFSNGGVVLNGRYATVNIYSEAIANFEHLSFTPATSYAFVPKFQEIPEKPGHEEMIPSGSNLGRPIYSLDEAWNRLARRLPDHNPEMYINDGFDEIQVYWAVTRLFESLTNMGFSDPELSTRPFHAFLYYPDISYRDNAFYTDDTINFTTYSPKSGNMARDNTTIWHELGHGVMDRIMGDHIRLSDTGGLSEGMADFVASLVVNDVTGGLTFPGKDAMRINNNTAFHLTNEVHDDGEAYGGAMNDLLEGAVAHYGRQGLEKVSDLTFEAMRLSRNHPQLTANDWFERVLFADALGDISGQRRERGPVRGPGELRALILSSLNGRNFEFTGMPAEFHVFNGADEVTSSGPGSRPRPIPLNLAESENQTFQLKLNLKNGDHFKFQFPVSVRIEFLKSPLQGAVHWQGEESSPQTMTINSESEVVNVPLSVSGKCDYVNRPDGSCVDYVHLQVLNQGLNQMGEQPVAKKRFYVRVIPKSIL